MTRITKFADAFWGTDYVGTSGFDALVKRLKEGRQMCRAFDEYVRARARVEEDYCKSLLKLARTVTPGTELGTLKSAWEALRQQTETVAKEHQEASNAMMEAVQRINDFSNKHKAISKQEEDNARKAIKKKLDLYKKVNEAKKSYQNRCQEKDQVDTQVAQVKTGNVNTQPKDLEKLYNKQSRIRQDQERAEQHYRNCVDSLEHCRQLWEKDHIQACNVFQSLEEERILVLRNELWVQANIMSQTYVDNDQHCEMSRLTLEKVNPLDDISLFIQERKTGLDRPAAIQYEPCGSASVAVATCSGANRYHTMNPRTSHHHSSHAHHSMAHSHHGPLHTHVHASHHASGQSHHASAQSHHGSAQSHHGSAQAHHGSAQSHHAPAQSHHASAPSHHASGSSQHASGGHSHHHSAGMAGHSHHGAPHNNHQDHAAQGGMRPEQARKIHIVEEDPLYSSVTCGESYSSDI